MVAVKKASEALCSCDANMKMVCYFYVSLLSKISCGSQIWLKGSL